MCIYIVLGYMFLAGSMNRWQDTANTCLIPWTSLLKRVTWTPFPTKSCHESPRSVVVLCVTEFLDNTESLASPSVKWC